MSQDYNEWYAGLSTSEQGIADTAREKLKHDVIRMLLDDAVPRLDEKYSRARAVVDKYDHLLRGGDFGFEVEISFKYYSPTETHSFDTLAEAKAFIASLGTSGRWDQENMRSAITSPVVKQAAKGSDDGPDPAVAPPQTEG
jgi:hypothetical protein